MIALHLSGTGAFALVVPDADPAPAVPAPGEVLPGVVQADLPPTAVGQAAVEPSVLPPSGGKATGRLFVQSPTPLPSGTVVQAKVTEEFELASGKKASEEVRRQDILLFRAPLPQDAPTTATGETVAGRESVRGRTGGNRGLTLQSGGAILSVPASSLPEDTVVDIDETALSSFLPAASDLEPLSEVVLDFAGAVLGTSAGLSVEGVAQAGDTLLVARVERVLGIPRLLVVALGEANGGRIAAAPVPGLPGIKEGGRYVFYRLSQPVGWMSGATTLASTGAPVGGAIVESDGLPFIGRSRLDAPYVLVARAGTAQVSATVPGTRLVASGSATVVAGGLAEAVSLPLAFSGAVTTATVTPADTAQGVAVSVQVEVEATAALDPSPTNLSRAKLFKGTEPVEVKLLLSGSGKRLAVVPVKPLDVSIVYRFTAADARQRPLEETMEDVPRLGQHRHLALRRDREKVGSRQPYRARLRVWLPGCWGERSPPDGRAAGRRRARSGPALTSVASTRTSSGVRMPRRWSSSRSRSRFTCRQASPWTSRGAQPAFGTPLISTRRPPRTDTFMSCRLAPMPTRTCRVERQTRPTSRIASSTSSGVRRSGPVTVSMIVMTLRRRVGEGWKPRPRGCGPSAWRRTGRGRTRRGGPRAPSRRPARSRPRSSR